MMAADRSAEVRAAGARWLEAHRARLVAEITELYGDRSPASGPRGSTVSEDIGRHLDSLRVAAAADAPSLFVDDIAWDKVVRLCRGLPEADLVAELDATRTVLEAEPARMLAPALVVLDDTQRALPGLPARARGELSDTNPHGRLARAYLAALVAGERQVAAGLILGAVGGGVPVPDLYQHVLTPAQRELGRLWQMDELSVAAEHYGTAMTQQVMALLYPRIFAAPSTGRRLVVAAVADELHELGARMVADVFALAGWETHYLGANTPLEGLAELVAARRADLVLLSATMTRHVPAVATFIAGLRVFPGTASVPVLVGGHPFTLAPALWRHVGADGWAPSAESAVDVGRRLVEEGRAGGR